MHHVVQRNMWNELGYKAMLDALEECGVPYTSVDVVPFAHTLEPDVNFDGDVMVWGATTLGHIAAERGWKPGRFQNEKFDMRHLKERFGPYFLNADAEFCTFGELQYEGVKFIRPVHDSKTFSGTTMDGAELAVWKQQVLNVSDGYSTLTMDTPVMSASPKKIDLEARFFVVDRMVITGSTYRTFGRQVIQRVENNPLFQPLLQFAKRMIGMNGDSLVSDQIDKAYVLDVAEVGGEHKVIEVNSINSSGFYASNMTAVVRALENLRW